LIGDIQNQKIFVYLDNKYSSFFLFALAQNKTPLVELRGADNNVRGFVYFFNLKRENQMIIYQGKSQLDNQTDIVCIATDGTSNQKTGSMIQTWILNANLDPISANRWGNDRGICGDCIHKGTEKSLFTFRGTAAGRSCYVLLLGPQSIFRTYIAGGYKTSRPDKLTKLGRGRIIRVGSYGDPAAVPADIWRDLLKYSAGWTGYSHQLLSADKTNLNAQFLEYSDFCMLSADTIEQARLAWSQGLRTYRTVESSEEIDKQKEIICPASKEAGAVTTCAKCKLCSGSRGKAQFAKSIAIPVHGAGKKHFSTNNN